MITLIALFHSIAVEPKQPKGKENMNPLTQFKKTQMRHEVIRRYILSTSPIMADKNWLITPAIAPPTIKDKYWLLVLSGVAICNFKGQTTNDWSRDTVYINPDISSPMNWAIAHFSIPTPPLTTPWPPAFQVQQWSPFATINSIFE